MYGVTIIPNPKLFFLREKVGAVKVVNDIKACLKRKRFEKPHADDGDPVGRIVSVQGKAHHLAGPIFPKQRSHRRAVINPVQILDGRCWSQCAPTLSKSPGELLTSHQNLAHNNIISPIQAVSLQRS